MARYEWQPTKAGRRFVRIDDSNPRPAAATVVFRPAPLAAVNLHPDRSEFTKAGLIAAAESRGLDTSGNKPDILARLVASDE